MSNREEISYLVDELLNKAVNEFRGTEQYNLLKEKMEQMECDCDSMLMADEKDFVFECFELIMDVNGREEAYVYNKAFKDCVSVLRWMGVLS